MTDIQHPSAMYFNVLKLLQEKLVYFLLTSSHRDRTTLLHATVVVDVDDLLLTYNNSPPFQLLQLFPTLHISSLCCLEVNVEWNNSTSMRKNANNFGLSDYYFGSLLYEIAS